MTNALRHNRKITDEDALRLNAVGLSISTMAKLLNCHPSSVSLRLKSLKVEPQDTRKSFMEGIFTNLSEAQQEALADYLFDNTINVQEYILKLVEDDMVRRLSASVIKTPHEDTEIQDAPEA